MSLLWDRYQALKAGQPRLRVRDAAAALHVSECELAAADPTAVRLQPHWEDILSSLASLGRVMALTRNHACVHETLGLYDNVSFEGKVGLAMNPVIDLRIFLFHWRYGFVLRTATPRGVQRSLQFFDRHGDAVHKVFLTEESNIDAFDALAARFAEAPAVLMLEPVEALPGEAADEAVDLDAFRAEWLSLKDVHEFHPFLRRWGVSRRQGFRLAPKGQAWRVAEHAVEQLLRRAAATALPIMIFAGNRSLIQIHTGPISNVSVVGDWLNVLDSDFNLHLRTDLVAEAWVTRKPGDNGVVTSLELFDDAGESLVTFFGERKPGRPERAEWVKLLGELPLQEQADVA